MNRNFAFSGAIPLNTDLLSTEINAYIGIAKLAGAILGTNNLVNNATCVPTAPASLQVSVGPCEFYSLQEVDASAYGDLGTNTNQIVKQGVNLSTTLLSITAPSTVGYSQNYLIEFGFTEIDGVSVVLAYYNASNPASPFSGPGNSGSPNNTVRQDQVSIIAKAGIAAPTGTQTTPAPDSGYIGGFVVTVTNGQTTITSGNIANYATPNTSFINETLPQKISQTTADVRYAQKSQVQTGQFIYGVDTSVSANTLTVALSPAITSYTAGMSYTVLPANTNTGASTANFNSVGPVSILREDSSALQPGDIPANKPLPLFYNGTNFLIVGAHLWQFGSNLAATYQKLPSGLIIQAGNFITNASQGANVSVTFPIAFPTACTSVSAITTANSTSVASVCLDSGSLTLSGARFRSNGVGQTAFYTAIGY